MAGEAPGSAEEERSGGREEAGSKVVGGEAERGDSEMAWRRARLGTKSGSARG